MTMNASNLRYTEYLQEILQSRIDVDDVEVPLDLRYALLPPNDPSSATRPASGHDCNREVMAGFAAAHG